MKYSFRPSLLKATVSFATAWLSIAGGAQGPGPLYTISTVAGTDPYPFTGDGGPATAAFLNAESLARDRAGNLYVGERGNGRVRKITPSGIITTVAGPGVSGFSADGAPGTVHLGFSLGVAVDDTGTLYIADTDSNRVLKLAPSGAVSTIAGTGVFDSTGDGGPAVAAALRQPFGLAVDRSGTLYIGEYGGYRVRRVTPDGIITTVAGNGQFGFTGDGGRATDATLEVWGVAVDDAGGLYIADGYSRIRKVTPGGMITTVAGGRGGFSGDGLPATSAELYAPSGVTVDHAGNLYIADTQNQRVRKVTADGVISTIAGTGMPGVLLGNGRDAKASQLSWPVAVVTDDAGTVYVADGLVRKVDTQGRVFTIAGSGSTASDDGGSATAAQFASPEGVAVDADGSVYVSDRGARTIRKVDLAGIITTVAGDGEEGYAGDGGPATAAPLNAPQGIVLDSAENLYIADRDNQRIRVVGVDGTIHTVAGSGVAGFMGDGGPAIAAQLSGPTAVAMDNASNIYISDTGNNRIRKVTPNGIISTIAGGGDERPDIGDGAAATNASLLAPRGIVADPEGNLYIADAGHHRVRKVSPGGAITTVAGIGLQGQVSDGRPATETTLLTPTSVAIDAEGDLFIDDFDDDTIRRVRPDGTMDTVAGNGTSSGADGAPGFLMPLLQPMSIAMDAHGNLYIAEISNLRVRKASVLRSTGFLPPSILPQAVVNAADLHHPIAPGELVTLFGTDLGPLAGVSGAVDASGRFPTKEAGVRVLFDGIPGPVLWVQAYQINAIVPFGISPKSNVQVQVDYSGSESAPVSIAVEEAAPAIFTLDPPPHGRRAAAFNEDGTINSPVNPAAVGSVLVLYATGAGLMQPPLQDGAIVKDSTPKPVLPVSVLFSRTTAELLYAGPAPGLVAGVLQINVRVPVLSCSMFDCPDPNAVPIVLGIGAPDSDSRAKHFSQGIATVAVRY